MISVDRNEKSLYLANPVILSRFAVERQIALTATIFIVLSIFTAWNWPRVGAILPEGWSLMQATTALTILFLSTALFFMDNEQKQFLGKCCALFAIAMAGITFYEHWHGLKSILGYYLVAGSTHAAVHPSSIQSAVSFLLLGGSILIGHNRQDWLGIIQDGILMLLLGLILLFSAGYIYNATNLIGSSPEVFISVHTLLCVTLLTFVQTSRRVPYSYFSVLASRGIAGQMVRIMLPFSLVLSYIAIYLESYLTDIGMLNPPYNSAFTAVMLALILMVVITFAAYRINLLEMQLHAMSITDDLTGIYNRRGFYLHAEQELAEAKRLGTPLTILYCDVDHLKEVNDLLGHDIGSQLLIDVADILQENFRVSDIVGRLGGDEFAVITHGMSYEIEPAIARLRRTVEQLNENGEKPYTISFSMGTIEYDSQSNMTLDTLLSSADARMYREKQQKRSREAPRPTLHLTSA